MHRSLVIVLSLLVACAQLPPQPEQIVLHREEGSITFAVDDVEPLDYHLYREESGLKLAESLHNAPDGNYIDNWNPEIVACSFAADTNLCHIGEDVVFQMLMQAWSEHRPVVLSPDVIWLLICQQFSHYVSQNPEKVRHLMVDHKGRQQLVVRVFDKPQSVAAWGSVIDEFAGDIAANTNNGIASALVADFTTTAVDERIASEVTLMDVVKPYFEYIVVYGVCGIPSITVTGTPQDWHKVMEKTRSLEQYGLKWWVKDLLPILEQFARASEGDPDYWFWKDIVKKTRPREIQGPTCDGSRPRLTKFDGWFLKFFPFDNDGRTPKKVTVTQTMLAETVAVPFKYREESLDGVVLGETTMEIVAGIVGVQEDTTSFSLTPRIGWFVRTARPVEDNPVSAE